MLHGLLMSCRKRCLRLSVLWMAVVHAGVLSAQQYTVGLSGGMTLPFASYLAQMRTQTMGAEWMVAWPACHDQVRRAPCKVGVKGSAAFIPAGVAGDRLNVEGFVTTPFPYVDRVIRPCSLSFLWGFGLGLYTRPYDLTGDSRNTFIGSAVNSAIEFGPLLTLPAGPDHAWVLATTFVHNSNGYLHKPNIGLNYLQCGVGYRFSPSGGRHSEHTDTVRLSHRYDARTAPFITVAPGLTVPRDGRAGNDVFRPAYTVQLGHRYAYQPCRSLGLSVDLSYNFAEDYGRELEGQALPFPLTLGTSLTHETFWGPLSLRAGLGYYLWNTYPRRHVYERLGILWHFGPEARWAAGIVIKAHVARADFIEWCWTYDLR